MEGDARKVPVATLLIEGVGQRLMDTSEDLNGCVLNSFLTSQNSSSLRCPGAHDLPRSYTQKLRSLNLVGNISSRELVSCSCHLGRHLLDRSATAPCVWNAYKTKQLQDTMWGPTGTNKDCLLLDSRTGSAPHGAKGRVSRASAVVCLGPSNQDFMVLLKRIQFQG